MVPVHVARRHGDDIAEGIEEFVNKRDVFVGENFHGSAFTFIHLASFTYLHSLSVITAKPQSGKSHSARPAAEAFNARDKTRKAHALAKAGKGFDVHQGRRPAQIHSLPRKRYVIDDARQPTGNGNLLLVREQLVRQAFCTANGELMQRIEGFKNHIDILVVIQKRLCGFGAETGNAGNIIDAVTNQREIVHQWRGANAKLALDARLVESLIFAVVPQVVLGTLQQLAQILVATENGDRRGAATQAPRQGAKQVIGFELLAGKTGDTHQFAR